MTAAARPGHGPAPRPARVARRRHRGSRGSAAALLAGLAACGGGAPTDREPPPLPPLELQPRQAFFEELAAAPADGVPPRPEGRALANLEELMVTAFSPDASGGDERLAARARSAVLEDEAAFWVLEDGLEHDDAAVRSFAAFELGKLGRQASLWPLLLRIKYEKDPGVRVWVCRALTMLGNHGAVLDLAALIDDDRSAQQAGAVAIDVLREAGRDPGEQPTFVGLQRGLRALHAAWREVGHAGEAPPPMTPLSHQRVAAHLAVVESFELRPVDDARFVLARSGRLAVPLIGEAVRAEEAKLRSAALEIVLDLGPCAAELAPRILPLIADQRSAPFAARALGAMRHEPAVPYLLAMLAGDDLERQVAAAMSLGPLGARTTAPRLRALMDDEQAPMDLRVAAAFSVAVFELENPGLHFLEQRLELDDYHASRVRELIDRIDALRTR